MRKGVTQMRKTSAVMLAVFAFGLLLAAGTQVANATTEAAKLTAIENGLKWLAAGQSADGSWPAGDIYYRTAATGAALLAFEEEGFQAGTDVVIGATNYGDVVGKGLNFLLSQATVYAIANEPAGNPDGDGNGIGVKFVTGGNNNRDTYVTGLVVPAIVRSGTPNALVTGPLAARTDGSGAGGAWTYKDVVQNSIDYFAYGQADPGNNARGGWRYYADYGEADNSTAQWPVISSLFATEMGVSTPAFVKSELKNWINFIQNADGGSDYDTGHAWGSNMTRTGSLLIEMAYAGYATGTPAEQAKYAAAMAYLNSQWNTYANASWNGNFGHPYAMWDVYKALETTIGLDSTGVITPRAQGTAVLDTGDVWNWWEDYCEWIVSNQAGSGAWGGYDSWNAYLATPWFINILNATETPINIVPEPVTMAGLLLGVGGLVRYVRRRK